MKKRTDDSCILIWISFGIVICLILILVYNKLTTVYEGVCYKEGATVIDVAECCNGGVIISNTVDNQNVYTPLYKCNGTKTAASEAKKSEFDRVNHCFKAGAIRPDKMDCCNSATNIKNLDASGNLLPMTYSCQ